MALIKLLFLVQSKIVEKAKPVAAWRQIMSQFAIIFEDRWID
jgi:hypothetical protein